MSLTNFNNLLSSGAITKQPRASYDLDTARREYIEYIRAVAAGRAGEDGLDLAAERARLAKEQADAQAMKNAVQRGELIPRTDVVAGIQTVIAHCRAKLLSLPGKMTPLVSGAGTAAVKEKLTDAIHEALAELSATRAVPSDAGRGDHVCGDHRGADDMGTAAEADGERVGRQESPPQRRSQR